MTFEKHLGIDSSNNKWLGLKLSTISVLIAFVGGLISFLEFDQLGYWALVLGVIGTIIGLLLHILILIRSLFAK